MLKIGDQGVTVEVDGGRQFTGTVYYVRENGWPCIETDDRHVASGPVVECAASTSGPTTAS